MVTNAKISKLKPKEKTYLIADFDGLYIQVRPTGTKTFLYIYTKDKKRIKKVIGKFTPNFDLNKARLELAKIKNEDDTENKVLLKDVVNEWYKIKEKSVELKTFMNLKSMLDRTIICYLGNKKIKDITRNDIITAIDTLGDKIETKRKTLNYVKNIYSYAFNKEYIKIDVIFNVNYAIVFGAKSVKNFPTLTDIKDINKMFLDIANSKANLVVKSAIVFNALTALRPGNVTALKWDNVDFEKKVLNFSDIEMKMKKGFILPLSNQAIRVLRFLEKYAKSNEYVFASSLSKTGYLGENTARKLIRDLGYNNDKFTPHGFRAMFSTLANENDKDIDTIERCLAHTIGGVRGVYDRSYKLDQKKELMQWWGNFIEPHLHLDEVLTLKYV